MDVIMVLEAYVLPPSLSSSKHKGLTRPADTVIKMAGNRDGLEIMLSYALTELRAFFRNHFLSLLSISLNDTLIESNNFCWKSFPFTNFLMKTLVLSGEAFLWRNGSCWRWAEAGQETAVHGFCSQGKESQVMEWRAAGFL